MSDYNHNITFSTVLIGEKKIDQNVYGQIMLEDMPQQNGSCNSLIY